MTSPHARPHEEPPAISGPIASGDVADRRLWALAAAVAAAHPAGADGRCTNLQCHGQSAPCEPARNAYAAAHRARRPPDSPPPAAGHPARGRAAVPVGPSGRAGLLDPPEGTTPVDPATDRKVFTPSRGPWPPTTRRHQEEHP
jgi:hypothetical protein